MKKIALLITLLFFLSCSNSEKPVKQEIKDPFKSGEMVYLKLDTTKVLIKLKLGQFDEENYLYRISYKNDSGLVISRFAYSSELFK